MAFRDTRHRRNLRGEREEREREREREREPETSRNRERAGNFRERGQRRLFTVKRGGKCLYVISLHYVPYVHLFFLLGPYRRSLFVGFEFSPGKGTLRRCRQVSLSAARVIPCLLLLRLLRVLLTQTPSLPLYAGRTKGREREREKERERLGKREKFKKRLF